MYYIDRRYLLTISHRLRNFKEKRPNLFNCSCPLCGDSQINDLKARGYFYESKNSLRYKCWNCGLNLSFSWFLKTIDPPKYKEYVLEKFQNRNKKFTLAKEFVSRVTSEEEHPTDTIGNSNYLININDLPDNHYAKEYVKNRKIPENRWSEIHYTNDFKTYMDNTYPHHGKNLKEDDPRLIWFLTNLHGKMTHVCGRALAAENNKLRYIKIRVAGNDNEQKIFGFDHIQHLDPLYVVEGEIDSMFLNNAVAPGDSSLELAANALWERFKPWAKHDIQPMGIVLVFDNQPRNKQIVRQMREAIKNKHQIVIWPKNMQGGKDINEMILSGYSSTQIEEILMNNIFSGPLAELKFNDWSKW